MPKVPIPSAKIETGNSDRFTDFMRKLVQVPHTEIKAKLEEEKAAKRTSNRPASRASVYRPKRAI